LNAVDRDLQAVYDAAGRVTPAGVQRLVDALQWYRDGANNTFEIVEGFNKDAHNTSSLERVRGCFDLAAASVAELKWHLDLDHIDIGEVT